MRCAAVTPSVSGPAADESPTGEWLRQNRLPAAGRMSGRLNSRPRRYLINPRTNRNAASTCLISSLVRRPATSPKL